ncbi:MAG: hypothetical protein SCARUB_01158 [Candidatus Scalindua rubra]|uniref:Uncharacterized protein n=1 Tax=Candidatus Scalindua rubra TaxID=1872076 RepID=A0A1E3XDK3_9BACT|nr:MAG: hypothetical protein SCARUB_01158 [Candidatus Scalindua rubra]
MKKDTLKKGSKSTEKSAGKKLQVQERDDEKRKGQLKKDCLTKIADESKNDEVKRQENIQKKKEVELLCKCFRLTVR